MALFFAGILVFGACTEGSSDDDGGTTTTPAPPRPTVGYAFSNAEVDVNGDSDWDLVFDVEWLGPDRPQRLGCTYVISDAGGAPIVNDVFTLSLYKMEEEALEYPVKVPEGLETEPESVTIRCLEPTPSG